MPDRYADAVRARRGELRAARELLGGTHRGELRSELALSRLAASAATTAALAGLAREAHEFGDAATRGVRAQLPGLLAAALDAVARAVHARWAAELAPALRRIATTRSLDVAAGPGWPRLPDPRLPVLTAGSVPVPARPARPLLTGAAEGLALWRLAVLPLAVLPLFGLPALGGAALAPLAVGVGVAGAAVVVRSRRAALERAALRRCTDAALATARAAIDADVARWLLELERAVGTDLDAAVARRRAAVEAELRALAPEGAMADG
jgi:hypothetical protein